jgi:phosphatidylethanolamine-binding protein (PEBP) family uncharacterized protein
MEYRVEPYKGSTAGNATIMAVPAHPPDRTGIFFKLYALDAALNLSPASTKADLERAMQGHTLATGQLMGTYKRR